jgi:uncharacterized protein (TIGR03437 family)
VAVSFSASDPAPDASGVDYTEYRLDGGAWTRGTSCIVPAPPDTRFTHTIFFRSADLAGNLEAVKFCQVKIDTIVPPPTVMFFTPTSGSVGSTVTVAGGGFTGATAVHFNGVAASFTVVSAMQITATVPADAATGPIAVTTPGGIAVSAADFTVTPLDTTPPVTTATGFDDAWHAAPVAVSFSASDPAPDASGVDYTEYRLDGGAWTRGTQVTVPAPPDTKYTHTIVYRSADLAGNLEGAKTCQVKIDTTVTPPPTIARFTPSSGPAGTAVTLTGTRFTGATAVSFNGAAATSFSVTSATRITATVPAGATSGAITVITPGGSATSATSFSVTVPPPTDATPPVTTVSGYDSAWRRAPVTLGFSAIDIGAGASGVAYTEWSVDDGLTWNRGVSAWVGLEGETVLLYRSADNAGNVEAATSITVRVDTTGPTISTKNAQGRVGHAVALKLRVNDALSPQASAISIIVRTARGVIVMRWSGGGTLSLTGVWIARNWTPKAAGSYRYTVTARDLAGNAQVKKGNATVTVKK